MSGGGSGSQRLYPYVGDDTELAALATGGPASSLPRRSRLTCPADALRFADLLGAVGLRVGVTFTFVVDAAGDLYLADRYSEHVACARGGPVLAAGEITFRQEGPAVVIGSVTNQSTGYCPEPECWPAVAAALLRGGFGAGDIPQGFAPSFVFRSCPNCGQRNVVKENWFVCGVCGADLPAVWNFAL